ncbi:MULTISPECIES: hypothetical protein [Pseudomonas]|uniref:Uncharacterized protein n=1 Tax=Pseudomonas tritici TaxID=2745518 RepID=A0A8I0CZH6_9PSED|nr:MULTISPECIES: hypothetical protein [Pseudomonas]MBP2873374.1 hypothetical protein [Pseudomonas sp. SWRI144]QXH84263.1 hypothetical protein HU722_0001905 [Pseudomonas tritici]
MIKDHLSVVALVVGLALSTISLKQWFSAPAIELSASVESSAYRTHPSIQEYIGKELTSVSDIEANLEKIDNVKIQGFTSSQLSLVANLLRDQAYSTKYSFDNDARTFLVYTIDNSGDKAATNVGLVNYLEGVALIEGASKSIRVSDKEPIELGEIPPRSSKVVYFWTSDYFFLRGNKTYVKYSDGTIDVDATVPLGGLYRHFHEFSIIYQFVIIVIALFLVIFLFDKYYGKTSAAPTVPEQAKPKRRRRRTRSKARPVTPSED